MHCFLTDVSSSATIVSTSGSAAGAILRVLRPGNMPDDAVATYLIQSYSDAEGKTKVGQLARVLFLLLVLLVLLVLLQLPPGDASRCRYWGSLAAP